MQNKNMVVIPIFFSKSDENFKITGDLLQFGGTIIMNGGSNKVSTCVGVVA